MHPRNIYNTLPDFKELAVKYPEFSRYVKVNLAGRATVDFKNPAALRQLTKTLLHKDFNLNVEIPENHLIPTLPLRLNYILWIEDLINSRPTYVPADIHGIDIGTGPCCIYPLLAASKRWRMLATEIDPISAEIALQNVEANNLSKLITIKLVQDSDILLSAVDDNTNFTFCLCNPPFFAPDEQRQNRTNKRTSTKSLPHGSPVETHTEGGEVEFVKKIINDSIKLHNRVCIYSSMLGKKSSIKILIEYLKFNEIKYYIQTEFIQGKTHRWGLAWSFSVNISVTSCHKKLKNKPISTLLPTSMELNEAETRLYELLQYLKMSFEVESPCVCRVTVFENTWSHQRRKKRKKLLTKETVNGHLKTTEADELPSVANEDNDKKVVDSGGVIHSVAENSDGPPCKKVKCTTTEPEAGQAQSSQPSQHPSILQFLLKIFKSPDDQVILEGTWFSGSAGKEGLHQILQYLKNNWQNYEIK